jgi:hypothetical protein
MFFRALGAKCVKRDAASVQKTAFFVALSRNSFKREFDGMLGRKNTFFVDKCSECGKKPLLCCYGMGLREACNLIKGKYFVRKKATAIKLSFYSGCIGAHGRKLMLKWGKISKKSDIVRNNCICVQGYVAFYNWYYGCVINYQNKALVKNINKKLQVLAW